MNNQTSTRTPETEKAYLDRGKRLWTQASKSSAISEANFSLSAYLAWLDKKLWELEPASRRQYIAASRALLRSIHVQNLGLSVSEQKAFDLIMLMQSSKYNQDPKVKRWRGRTSAQKARRISAATLKGMIKAAGESKSKWAHPAMVWMGANLIVGLRPSEWRYARIELIDNTKWLVVNNAKNTNGRANGNIRRLDLTRVREKSLRLIENQLEQKEKYAVEDGAWNVYCWGVSRIIRLSARKELGRNQRHYPALYTTRHQFAGDAKASGLSKNEVAALMGHAVDSTAGIHYCQKRFGNSGMKVFPDPAAVATVRIAPAKKSGKGLHKK